MNVGGDRPRRPYGHLYRLLVLQLYYVSRLIVVCTNNKPIVIGAKHRTFVLLLRLNSEFPISPKLLDISIT